MPVKKILMILQSDYPPDIRLTKEIKSFITAGYSIYLLCNNKLNLPLEEYVNGATVVRLRFYRWLPEKIRLNINLPVFFNPIWIWKIITTLRKYRIDVIHVHDLPLALTGVIIGRIKGIPIVFDMHENYPAALKVWGMKGLLSYMVRNPYLATILEKICLRYADKIIVVIEEHKELLVSRGVNPRKIYVVSNTVEDGFYNEIQIDHSITKQYRDYYVLLYVGQLSPERDLDTPIRAIHYLVDKFDKLKLVIVGEGVSRNQLEELVVKEGVSDWVDFTGWVKFELTASYIQSSKICIIPQPSNPLIDNGVPHKLFQYMVLGKPVIVSDARASARIVNECQCGEIFRSHSPEDFANIVYKIHESTLNYGENGKKAVSNKYNWNKSSKELLKLYREL